jgi:LysR family pca operon transcriptional activator
MIDRRIKLRHLQSFVEIARQQSMKKAADALFLSQPTVSKTLKELEAILGTMLMTRSRAGVDLTPQGEIFLRFAEMSVAALRQGLDGIGQMRERSQSRLAIGALPSVAARLLPEAVLRFNALASGTVLSIISGPHGYLVERLRHGALDLVVGRLGDPAGMRDISFTHLYSEHVTFAVRPGHPLLRQPNIQRLSEWPVIYPERDSAIRPLVERLLIANGVGELPDRVESVSGAFGRVYARRTDAVWIISAGVAALDLAEGRLVELPFETDLTLGPIGLMTRAQQDRSPPARLFQRALTETVSSMRLQ